MRICQQGYLNAFVKPVAEGGWGLPEWIVSITTEARGYSLTEIYDAIQSSDLDASIKAMDKEQIGLILTWMIGKTISGLVIGNPETETITYLPEEIV